MTRHEWDRNKPKEKWSTCSRCGLEVKTWRIKKGGIPKCLGVQRKLFEVPPCKDMRPPMACVTCHGRYNAEICDQLRTLIGTNSNGEVPPFMKTSVNIGVLSPS